MNERIKDLAKQSGFYVYDDKIFAPTTSEDTTKFQLKFVELLVKECAEITKNIGEHGHIAANEIKQHFGVK